MFMIREEIGATDLLFCSQSEMPSEPSEITELVGPSCRAVFLLPHLSCDGRVCLWPREFGDAFLPEALVLAARHLLLRRGLPLDDLSFLSDRGVHRIAVAGNSFSFFYKIPKLSFEKTQITLGDCSSELCVCATEEGSVAILLCDDACPLDLALLFRLARASVTGLSALLCASVREGTLLMRRVGAVERSPSLLDAMRVLSLCRSLGRESAEVRVYEGEELFVSLLSTTQGRVRASL